MQIKRKLTDREQRLLQILNHEKQKAISEIANSFDADTQDVRTIVDYAVDNVDISTLGEMKETNWTIMKSYNEKIKNIEDAVQSLTEGTYGLCQNCGQPISEKRLEALPFALYCIKCQKEKEDME